MRKGWLLGCLAAVAGALVLAQTAADTRLSSRQVSTVPGEVLSGSNLTQAATAILGYLEAVPPGGISRTDAAALVIAQSASIVSNQAQQIFDLPGSGMRFSVTGMYNIVAGGTVSVDRATVTMGLEGVQLLTADILTAETLKGPATLTASNLTGTLSGMTPSITATNLNIVGALNALSVSGELLHAPFVNTPRIIGISSQAQIRVIQLSSSTALRSARTEDVSTAASTNELFRAIYTTNVTGTLNGLLTNTVDTIYTNTTSVVSTNWTFVTSISTNEGVVITNTVATAQSVTNTVQQIYTNTQYRVGSDISTNVVVAYDSASRYLGQVWTNTVTKYYAAVYTNAAGRVYIPEPTGVRPSGSGTASSPYLINSVSNLLWCTQQTFPSTVKYMRQQADLDLLDSYLWNYGTTTYIEGFRGVAGGTTGAGYNPTYLDYDGQNKLISGAWRQTRLSSGRRVGLLLDYMVAGRVRNVRLSGRLICSGWTSGGAEGINVLYIGGLLGHYRTSTGGYISNVVATVDMEFNDYLNNITGPIDYVGGLIGEVQVVAPTALNIQDVSQYGRVDVLVGTNLTKSIELHWHELYGWIVPPTVSGNVRRSLVLQDVYVWQHSASTLDGSSSLFGGFSSPNNSYDIHFTDAGNYGSRNYRVTGKSASLMRPRAIFGLCFADGSSSGDLSLPLTRMVAGFDTFRPSGLYSASFSAENYSTLHTNFFRAVVSDTVQRGVSDLVEDPSPLPEYPLFNGGNGCVVYASSDRMTKSYDYEPANLAGGGGRPTDPDWPYEGFQNAEWTKPGQLCGWYPVPKVKNSSLFTSSSIITNLSSSPAVYTDIGGGLYVGVQTNYTSIISHDVQTLAFSNRYAVGASRLSNTSVVLTVHNELYLRHEDKVVYDTVQEITTTTNLIKSYAASLEVNNPWVILGGADVTGTIHVVTGDVISILGLDLAGSRREHGMLRLDGTTTTNYLSGVTFAAGIAPAYTSQYVYVTGPTFGVVNYQNSIAFDWWPDKANTKGLTIWHSADNVTWSRAGTNEFTNLEKRYFRFSGKGEKGFVTVRSRPASDLETRFAGDSPEAMFGDMTNSLAAVVFFSGGAYQQARFPGAYYIHDTNVIASVSYMDDGTAVMLGGTNLLRKTYRFTVDIISPASYALSDTQFKDAVQVVYGLSDIYFLGELVSFTRISTTQGRAVVDLEVEPPAIDLRVFGPYETEVRVSLDEVD